MLDKQPKTYTRLEYYVKQPLGSAKDAVIIQCRRIRTKLIGGWYCEYCKKEHNRRVVKYISTTFIGPMPIPSVTCNVCSLAIDDEAWRKEHYSTSIVLDTTD